MVESCVGPSELHLKKELTSLQRARFLRDPETCSSWRSPLSSKSFILTPRINNDNGIRRTPVGQSKSGASLEEHPRCETRNNEVYLCNWRHKSTVAGGSKELLDDDEKEGSVGGNQGNLNNSCTVDKNYTSIGFPLDIDHIADANSKNPIRRTVRKSRRRKGIVKHFAVSKFLDTASNSQILNSGQQSDDTENCGSGDLRQFTHHLSQKIGYASPSASPLFSGSGCGNWSLSSRTLKIQQRDESSQSCTPASANSYYKSGIRNPSTVSSWDETAASFDEDVLNQPELTSGQGCGIPCYWSKRTRNRGYGASCSPSLSDTLKRKGISILCGSQALYGNKKRSGYHKQKYVSKSSQGLPLLTNDFEEGGLSGDTASDELSANFGELDLEALSRLDGRRWSSCKSVEGQEIVRPGVVDLETADQRSLSQKYKPMSFDEIVGQNIVVQSLKNAIFRGRIAPAYLFQGPRGTGKTSIAQIFAAALNCLSDAENKPCWLCRECTTFSDRRMSKLKEVDATNKKDIDEVRYMLKNLSLAKRTVKYRIFVIEECHMLSLKIWSLFSKFLEEPFPGVVFIFVTVDPENLPCAITSRCQKYILSKIKDIDIVCRLRKLCAQENFDVNLDALDLIALNSDGSLRDAETMLDQLSLLGRKITTSLVNDLVGVVSDEKLLDLLEIAMSSDTAETVKRSREIMDSGVDPIALMSQLAGLIMDIIAGTYRLAKSRGYATALGGPSLTEAELERLQQSLKILSDAEKQLRLSSERSTWFTAALLQLGSGHNTESSHSTGSIRSKQSNNKTSYRECNISNSSTMCSDRKSLSRNLADCDQVNDETKKKVFKCLSPQKLDKIWIQCVDRCHSKTLKQLLSCHGRLASITESEGVLIAFIVFEDSNIKSRAERFLSSITNSIEMVLGHNVEVKIGLVSEYCIDRLKSTSEPSFHNPLENYKNKKDVCDSSKKKKDVCDSQGSHSKRGRFEGTPNMSRKSMDSSKEMLEKTQEQSDNFTNAEKSYIGILSRGHCDMCNSQENAQLASAEMSQRTEINEQRLESAWLQDAEKHVPGSMSHVKPEKNQVMPQCDSHQSSTALSMPSNHWEDELSHEVKALKINGHEVQYDNKVGGGDNFTISPSLLHSNSRAIIDKDNLGYESGPGCNGLFCWKSNKDHGQKIKQGRNVGSRKRNRLSLFGQCTKLKETELK